MRLKTVEIVGYLAVKINKKFAEPKKNPEIEKAYDGVSDYGKDKKLEFNRKIITYSTPNAIWPLFLPKSILSAYRFPLGDFTPSLWAVSPNLGTI
ncbi:hypothetical protein CEXT_460421 [Caerostris extrusa]|uniref:Uncharacterized protein n=1 Tax=Caerostris extrusa TaxID=172846 RepID=A0AAV4QCG9_CAEEX|nr:hypothetical protein CEXT_460421 [Caerostris extrusa]